MQAFKAHVKDRDADVVDAVERAELDDSIRESIEQMNAGQLIDGEEALARLRAIR